MKPFTKRETIGTVLILLIVAAITLTGLIASIRRARDAQRMADLGSISNALEQFHEEYGFFPPSQNGNIKACKGDNFNEVITKLKELPQFDYNLFISGLRECKWGEDGLRDLADDTRDPYIKTLPIDPKSKEGFTYTYISNTKRYQVFAHLEGETNEDLYDPQVAFRHINCGIMECNVGKSYANTPLGKSIEEYEQELIDKARKK
jgi:type II secretory pathway pseudopilin PulG